jgi:hypothetical protein
MVIDRSEREGIKNMEAIDGSAILGQQKGTCFKASLSGAPGSLLYQLALTYLIYGRVKKGQ